MNKANILILARLLETLEEGQFNMVKLLREQDHVNQCGSPFCIAGWAAWLELGKPEELRDNGQMWDSGANNIINAALDFFDTEDGDWTLRNNLFLGHKSNLDIAEMRITPAKAAKTLRHLAETGRVVWDA